jgi:hypothetical protein
MDPEEGQDLSALMGELKGLNESIQNMNTQIEEIKAGQNVEVPIDPANDPDNAPPKDWKSLREEIRTEAETKAEEKIKAKEEAEEAKQLEIKEAEKEWDNKFDEMAEKAVKEGLLPEIKDAKDPNDAGNRARKDLFGFAAKVGTIELLDVADIVKDYNSRGMHFIIPDGKEPKDGSWKQSEYKAQGKNVPIGSSSNRVVTSGDGRLSYNERHRMSMDQLARRAKARYEIE